MLHTFFRFFFVFENLIKGHLFMYKFEIILNEISMNSTYVIYIMRILSKVRKCHLN